MDIASAAYIGLQSIIHAEFRCRYLRNYGTGEAVSRVE
jgi:hypothetical protein